MDPRHALFAILCIAALCAAGCTTTAPANTSPTATVTATPCAACAVNATPNPLANLTVDEQRLVAFVNEAAANARMNGREQALAAFNDRNGSFIRDDLYVFAYDMNGTVLALPFQPEVVGPTAPVPSTRTASRTFGTRLRRRGTDRASSVITTRTRPATSRWREGQLRGRPRRLVRGRRRLRARPRNDERLSQEPGGPRHVCRTGRRVRPGERPGACACHLQRPERIRSWEGLYIFAYDMNGTAIAHPFQPELIGTNRSEATDLHGTKFAREGIAAARNGSGFHESGTRTRPTTMRSSLRPAMWSVWATGSSGQASTVPARTRARTSRPSRPRRGLRPSWRRRPPMRGRAGARRRSPTSITRPERSPGRGLRLRPRLQRDRAGVAVPARTRGNEFLERDRLGGPAIHAGRVRARAIRRRIRLLRFPQPGARHGDRAEDELRPGVDGTYWIGAGTCLPVADSTPTR